MSEDLSETQGRCDDGSWARESEISGAGDDLTARAREWARLVPDAGPEIKDLVSELADAVSQLREERDGWRTLRNEWRATARGLAAERDAARAALGRVAAIVDHLRHDTGEPAPDLGQERVAVAVTTDAHARERLAEVRARVEGATPGPWFRDASWDKGGGNFTENVTVNSWDVARCSGGDVPPEEGRREQARRDADFIAHSREDVLWLLALVEGRRVGP